MLISYWGLVHIQKKQNAHPVDLYLIRIFISPETTYISRSPPSLTLSLSLFLLPFSNSFPARVNIHWEKHTAMVLPLIRPRRLWYIYARSQQQHRKNTSKTLITSPKVFFSLEPVSLSLYFPTISSHGFMVSAIMFPS